MSTNVNSSAVAISDGFSWRRLGMVARYYWPVIKWEVILFPVASLLIGLLIWLFVIGKAGTLASMASGLLSYGVIFAPLALMYERKRSYQMSLALPGANSEKSLFLLLYFCVAVPLLLYLPMWLCTCTMTIKDYLACVPDITPEIADRIKDIAMSPAVIGMGGCCTLAYGLTTLWIMVSSRRNVLIKGILIPLGVNYGLGFAAGLIMGILGFYMGVKHGMNNTEFNEHMFADVIVSITIKICYAMIVILAAYVGVAAVMVWRAIANRQI